MSDWKQRKAQMIAEYQAMVAQLPVSDEPAPPLDKPAKTTIHTRRDSKGNVYGYFPGSTTEGMLGWVADA